MWLPVLLLVASWLAAPAVARAQQTIQDLVQVANGGRHTCALTSTGRVFCWGSNANGQLGDGTTVSRASPVEVSGFDLDVVAIAVGFDHSCALTVSGGVKCWGWNGFGQLGDGTTTQRLEPVTVSGLGVGVTALTSGYNHTCAVTLASGAKCWGFNANGQLGDGSVSQRTTPVDVSGLATGVFAIHASSSHTCALVGGGLGRCWGFNNNGQLGDGSVTQSLVPVSVSGLVGATAIRTGSNHTCALTGSGGLKCWGANGSGQLGDGSPAQQLTPVDVSGLASGVTDFSTGSSQTCAVAEGVAKCWGFNGSGRLGDGTIAARFVPTNVVGLVGPVTAISTGFDHTCAIRSSGDLRCWGGNPFGQLGDGTTSRQLTHVDVNGLGNGMTTIPGGHGHTCAVGPGGSARCWGYNFDGQLGDGTTSQRLTPVQVSGLASGVAVISAGGVHTCAVTTAGAVRCWGGNSFGQLGDGTTLRRLTPVGVSGLGSGVAAVATGLAHSCALTTTGGVKCWGLNQLGQLGDGTNVPTRLAPVDVSGLGSGVVAISLGSDHSCALTSAGAVRCWGYNFNGQLGDGSTTTRLVPVEVSDLAGGVAAISAGYIHTCALTVAGGAKCWGNNGQGRLGDGSATQRLTPVDVAGLDSGVAAIGAGFNHSCARTVSGGGKCWGNNEFGQLGDGTAVQRPTPVDVLGLESGLAAIMPAARFGYTCGVTSTGAGKCWGDNQLGQLGIGGRSYLLPADVQAPLPSVLLGIGIEPLPIARAQGAELRAYRITISNEGVGTAQGVQLAVPVPVGLADVLWDCQAPGGCTPAAGSGAVAVSFDLGAGAQAQVELSGEVEPGVAFVEIAAQASTPSGGGVATTGSTADPANGIGLMKNGFEL